MSGFLSGVLGTDVLADFLSIHPHALGVHVGFIQFGDEV